MKEDLTCFLRASSAMSKICWPDLSADYLRLAKWRCQDPTLRAKVLGVDKPPPQIEGQTQLFGGAA